MIYILLAIYLIGAIGTNLLINKISSFDFNKHDDKMLIKLIIVFWPFVPMLLLLYFIALFSLQYLVRKANLH